jgi:subtilisin family serine protease
LIDPESKHKTDFSVLAGIEESSIAFPRLRTIAVGDGVTRVCSTERSRDRAMEKVRKKFVAHHIYLLGGEEIIIRDRIDLTDVDAGSLAELREQYFLDVIGTTKNSVTLKVTEETQMNPVRLAKKIESLEPEIHRLLSLVPHGLDPWHVFPNSSQADMRIIQALQITQGDPSVVIAVIDDGFDLYHPCFEQTRISPWKKNFPEGDDNVFPRSESTTATTKSRADFHGTSVASLIFATQSGAGFGLAPKCTFLPIRIQMHGSSAIQLDALLGAFKHASQHADVLCCSFGSPPASEEVGGLPASFRDELVEISEIGGKRGLGLPIVFSAGNEGVPTYLSATENINGIQFEVAGSGVKTIPRGKGVVTAFPTVPGMIIAGACTSTGSRAAYGMIRNLTLVTTSSDGHFLADDLEFYARQKYDSNGMLAAQNRHAGRIGPSLDRGSLPSGIDRHHYTRKFGGTSASAPLLAAAIGLLKSHCAGLTTTEVLGTLQVTANRNIPTIVKFNDPNLQGLPGEFGDDGYSDYHGTGLLNIEAALHYASKLKNGVDYECEKESCSKEKPFCEK